MAEDAVRLAVFDASFQLPSKWLIRTLNFMDGTQINNRFASSGEAKLWR
jgi:hypothetical protein